jgi:hypothetical protein
MWAWLCFAAGVVLLALGYTWGVALLLTPVAAWCIDEYRKVTDLIAAIRAGQRAVREDLAALARDNSAMVGRIKRLDDRLLRIERRLGTSDDVM